WAPLTLVFTEIVDPGWKYRVAAHSTWTRLDVDAVRQVWPLACTCSPLLTGVTVMLVPAGSIATIEPPSRILDCPPEVRRVVEDAPASTCTRTSALVSR